MAAASRTLFAVFKNLNAFSPFSLYISSSLSFSLLTLYRYSQFRLPVLSRFIGVLNLTGA